MSNTHSLKALQARTEPEEQSKRLEEKRRSLEEKTKILEEKARVEKLAIERKLLIQILQEENHTHDATIRELEEKIADLEQQMKPSFTAEELQSQTPSEPTQEMPKPPQEISDNINEERTVGELQEMLSQGSDRTHVQSEVEALQETTKKKKRGLF